MNRYDWSKLDAGWRHHLGVLNKNQRHFSVWDVEIRSLPPRQYSVENRELWHEAKAQLAKCRIRDTERAPVDNTPLFEAINRISAEIPMEEWERVPSYEQGSMIAAYGAPPPPKDWAPLQIEPLDAAELRRIINTPQFCPECGLLGLHMCKPPTPFQPWRRGPLVAWTLVNISCHDGRLTVVMKRGRGELIDETGPDDETLWERLGAKAEGYGK